MRLTLINQSAARIPRKFLEAWVEALDRLAARKLKPKTYRGRDLVIVFLNEKPARELNKKYRNKNYSTDVLSFASEDPSSLGELVICPQVITKQAAQHGLTLREELGYMVLHGFLHLLGYDHETSERDARRMFGLQDALFEELLKALEKKA